MSFHAEVMPPAQQDLLRRLGPVAETLGFHLGGGTAIAIHLGHRRSVDLDWFTAEPIADPLVLAERLRGHALDPLVTGVGAGTLHATIESIRVSFLEYRYARLRPLVRWQDFGCELASLEDLACMKLSAVAGRGAKKDFIDIYALGKTRFGLGEMLDLYQSKYRTEDVAHLVMSLTYFDDAELEAMPEMLWPVEWAEVKTALEAWIAAYASA